MKPRNKFERDIMELHYPSLPELTEDQIAFGKSEKVHPDSNFFVHHYKDVYCLNCGTKFRPEKIVKKGNNSFCKCPSCEKKLEHYERPSLFYYFGVYDIVKGIQVHRIFTSTKYFRKGHAANCVIEEVMQFWISPEGKTAFVSKDVLGLGSGGCYDIFLKNSKMEIRSEDATRAKLINVTINYPKKKILPIFKRNGFVPDKLKCHPSRLMTACLKDSFVEYLLKVKGYSILTKYMQLTKESQKDVRSFRNQFRIAFKNNYHISDFNSYIDYLDLLVYFEKDINSPHYICPKNFKEAHDYYVNKRNKIKAAIRREEKIKNIELATETYVSRKEKFFDFSIKTDKISITVPKTVQEFEDAGNKLNHCLYTSNYHEKESLILFAFIDDELIETAEVNPDTKEILQCRGLDNDPSKFNKLIVETIQKNIHRLTA